MAISFFANSYVAMIAMIMAIFFCVPSICAASPKILQSVEAAPGQGTDRIVRERQLVIGFDKNGDGWLNSEERLAARGYLESHIGIQQPQRFGKFASASPGVKISPEEIEPVHDPDLFAPGSFRTFFLDFAEADWEQQLAEFHGSDVDIPATMIVDGIRFLEVGAHFRGHNSFLAVPEGWKRGLALSLDFANHDQRLLGYRGLHLLNAYPDHSFIRGTLFLELARQYIPAPNRITSGS